MATSSAMSTSNQYIKYKIAIVQNSQNIAKNTSNVTVSVSAYRTNTGYTTYGTGTVYCTIDGKQYTAAITSDQKITSSGITLFSKTLDITHGSDGKKTLTCSAYISHSMFTSSSQSYKSTLSTIPRQANISTAPNFTDEENPTITYSNSAGNSVSTLQACISLDGSKADIAYRDVSKTGSSYTFALTDAERNVLRNACTTANSRKVFFYVKTVIGETTYYSKLQKTLTIVNATPKITTSVQDTSESALAFTGNGQKMIKGQNAIAAEIVAETYKGATVKSYSITNGTNTVHTSSATFLNSENNKFVLEVTDSRGNKASNTVTLEMIDYVPLTCNVEAGIALSAGDSTKAYVKYRVYGNYFNGFLGSVQNELSPMINVVGDELPVEAEVEEITFDGNTYSITGSVTDLDYEKQYTVQAYISDKLIRDVSNSSKILKAIPVFDWGEKDFNFNVDVSIKNNPIADFVVEQGIKGIWTYRKWNSGIAECWGKATFNNITFSSTWGTLYTSALKKVDYPFEFVDIPVETANLLHNGASNACWPYTESNSGGCNTTTQTAQYSIARTTATSATNTYNIHFHVIGKWK